ncbi:hypothetical protein CCACVL1_27427 [Corchorus capsularis]|uniref:Uncharacterized protein n=1 Tax=Corchorus capsularis TaxID=210143 RepID=A0A1R3GAG5_COCAP|nr:hypothetical protein CCACVL1_27427 [Corchorus capsularis]
MELEGRMYYCRRETEEREAATAAKRVRYCPKQNQNRANRKKNSESTKYRNSDIDIDNWRLTIDSSFLKHVASFYKYTSAS